MKSWSNCAGSPGTSFDGYSHAGSGRPRPIKYVTNGYPATPILIVSGLPENQYARNALRAAASGFRTKDGSMDEFLKAVRTNPLSSGGGVI
jgi:hypothetical protein